VGGWRWALGVDVKDHKKTTLAAQEVMTGQVEALEREEKPAE